MIQPQTLFLDPEALVPAAWRTPGSPDLPPVFNPGLLADGNGWILACRVVTGDGARRIAFCRLGPDFTPLPGTAFPFSDHVRFPERIEDKVARTWFADPRLYRLGLRTFVYWNSGWHEPRNHQFLQEIDESTLRPIGTARELLLNGAERRKLEKNWMLFEQDGRTLAVYSVQPHRVLACDWEGSGDIGCRDISMLDWTPAEYPACHGGLRGGAPPQPGEGALWSFCHTVHDGPEGYVYRATAYAFRPEYPFAPAQGPARAITLWSGPLPARRHARLNPAVAEVVYPCGLKRDSGNWVVSWGLNDERCALTVLTHESVTAAMASVATRE